MSLANISLPKYECVLPISKTKVIYRPFTVKEEKILLLAIEDGSPSATITSIEQVVDNCTFGKVSLDVLNKIDAEYLFVQLKNKSMGEGVNVNGICASCDHRTKMTLNFENVKVKNIDHKLEPIELFEGVWVTMKYPTLKESLEIADGDGIKAIAMSLDTIIEGDDSKNAAEYPLQERIDFVESLTRGQLSKFMNFTDNFPSLVYEEKFTCKCGHENTIYLEGIENFFG